MENSSQQISTNDSQAINSSSVSQSSEMKKAVPLILGVIVLLLISGTVGFLIGRSSKSWTQNSQEKLVNASAALETRPGAQESLQPQVSEPEVSPDLPLDCSRMSGDRDVLSNQDLMSLRQKMDLILAQNTPEKLFDLSVPDIVLDCTQKTKVEDEHPYLDPAICDQHSKETSVAFYSVGYVPEGTLLLKADAASRVQKFVKQYGPFSFTSEITGAQDCSQGYIYKNQNKTAAVKITIYKKSMDGASKLEIIPTLYTPDTINELGNH